MPDQNQQNPKEVLFSKLADTLSSDRIGGYLKAAGHDPDRALALYLWNAKMGEAFHLPIQAVEVGLRNRINIALQDLYGNKWWQNEAFAKVIDGERAADLDLVFRRTRNRKLPLDNGQIVAGLSFGFLGWDVAAAIQPPDMGFAHENGIS